MYVLKCVCLSLVFSSAMLWADATTEMVIVVYDNVLGYKPDEETLADLGRKATDAGWSAEDLEKVLKQSDAYYDKVIRESFQAVLGRDADEAALKTYRERLRKGVTEEQFRKSLRNSVEYRDMYRKEFKTDS